MVASHSALEIAPAQVEIPAQLRKVCFAFCAMNLTLCLMADLAHVWIKIGAPSSSNGPHQFLGCRGSRARWLSDAGL